MEKRKYEYRLYYKIDEEDLYAYTEDKNRGKRFESTRDMNLFYMKKQDLTSDDLHELHEEYSRGLLLDYKFYIGEDELVLPITTMEKITIENIGTMVTDVSIYNQSFLPIEIFVKELREALIKLGYTKASRYEHFSPNLLNIFIQEYGDLLKT